MIYLTVNIPLKKHVGSAWEKLFPTMDDFANINIVHTASGTANAITVSTGGDFEYIQGKYITIKASADNTGDMTINIDNKGAKTARLFDGSQIPAGSHKSGEIYKWMYDATSGGRFLLLSKAEGLTLDAHLAENATENKLGHITLQQLGVRNLLINGAFDIWQRGVSGFSGTGIYTADRWLSGNQVQNIIERRDDAPEGFKYSIYFQRNSSISKFQQEQRVDGAVCKGLAGKRITISYWAKRGLNDPQSTAVRLFYANSYNDFSSCEEFFSKNLGELTDSWQKYIVTTPPLPTEVINGMRVCFQINTGYNFPQGAQLSGCQLELGDIATPFEIRPLGLELMLCQRYFQQRSANNVNAIDLRPTMRVNPTITGVESVYNYDAEL